MSSRLFFKHNVVDSRGTGFPANGYVRLSANPVPLSPLAQCAAAEASETVLFFDGSDPGLTIMEAIAVPDPNLSASGLEASQGVWPPGNILIGVGGVVRTRERQAPLISIPPGLGQKSRTVPSYFPSQKPLSEKFPLALAQDLN